MGAGGSLPPFSEYFPDSLADRAGIEVSENFDSETADDLAGYLVDEFLGSRGGLGIGGFRGDACGG
jgi:hypothetical protein